MPPIENNEDIVTSPEDVATEQETTTPENPDADIDAILESLLKTEEAPIQVTEPVFTSKEEEKPEDIDEEATDEAIIKTLDELDASFEDLESQLEEASKIIETMTKDLEDAISNADARWEALDKLWDHPILWPLNTKIIQWEEVNIPEYLQKSIQEDLDALPNMNESIHEPTGIQEQETPQQRLEKLWKQRY